MVIAKDPKQKWYWKTPRRNSTNWSDQDREKLVLLKSAGLKVKEIARRYKATQNQINNQLRLARKALRNQCFRCGKPLSNKDIENSIGNNRRTSFKIFLCAKCNKNHRNYKKNRREEALKKGLCGACCKNPLVQGMTYCRGCLSATYRRRVSRGLCGICGKNPLFTASLCESCATKMRNKKS